MFITLRPTIKQDLVYEALKAKDEIFYGGAAGGGKSWVICESRLINCYLYPNYKSFIGREELKRLMQSTYLSWCKVCKYHKIPPSDWKLNGQYNYIEFFNGSRIDLLDLKYLPADPLYERFGSLEYSDGAIDEAGEIDYLAYEMLKSRIGRHLSDKIRPTLLIGGNPSKNWTYRFFYKPYREGLLSANKVFIEANYNDNPYTAEIYGQQLAKLTDRVLKERLMFGNWEYDDDPTTMMQYSNIIDLFTNTVVQSKEKYLVVDAARFGRDFIVLAFWQGFNWYKVVFKQRQATDETEEDIKDFAAKELIPYSHILIDEDGIGGGLVDHLRGVRGFVANRAPLRSLNPSAPESLKTNFKNLKAQCAYKLAEMVNEHKLRVSFQDEKAKEMLIADLEQYKVLNPDKDNKKQIISKEVMKEHLGRSPDFGDTALMRMWFELKAKENEQPEYKQPPYEPMSSFEMGGEFYKPETEGWWEKNPNELTGDRERDKKLFHPL